MRKIARNRRTGHPASGRSWSLRSIVLVVGSWSIAVLLVTSGLGCSDDSNPVTTQRFSSISDSTFAVGDSSALEISNFAGKVAVTAGNPQVVNVIAKKWARRQADLDEIEIEMVELQNGVRVTTTTPPGVSDVSVDLDVTAPPDSRPILQVGAGDISYAGLGEGECSFGAGAGNITLKLPSDVNVEIHLSVGAGTVRVEFPVVGKVSDQVVDGIIGTGADGRIVAQVGAGSITVIPQ